MQHILLILLNKIFYLDKHHYFLLISLKIYDNIGHDPFLFCVLCVSIFEFSYPYEYNDLAWFMVLNATFNNISAIVWWSVLLVEETTDMPQITDKLYHIMLYRVHLNMYRVRTHNFIGYRH